MSEESDPKLDELRTKFQNDPGARKDFIKNPVDYLRSQGINVDPDTLEQLIQDAIKASSHGGGGSSSAPRPGLAV